MFARIVDLIFPVSFALWFVVFATIVVAILDAIVCRVSLGMMTFVPLLEDVISVAHIRG